MKRWWLSLSDRDQGLLMFLAAVVVLTIAYVGIWEPLQAQKTQAAMDLEAAINEAVWVDLTAEEARALARVPVRAQVERGDESLLALVDRTARAHGLGDALKRAEPAGPRAVRVWFEAASFDQTLDWLQALNAAYGIHAGELLADRVDDDGLVNTNLTLREAQP